MLLNLTSWFQNRQIKIFLDFKELAMWGDYGRILCYEALYTEISHTPGRPRRTKTDFLALRWGTALGGCPSRPYQKPPQSSDESSFHYFSLYSNYLYNSLFIYCLYNNYLVIVYCQELFQQSPLRWRWANSLCLLLLISDIHKPISHLRSINTPAKNK